MKKMAGSGSTSDGFLKEFTYCQFCKLSHDNAKKHAYSKRHQATIQRLLQKFILKVQDMKSSIKNPCIQDERYEVGAKLWCYFCECDVIKHLCEDGVVICFGKALEHFRSVEHLKNAKHFCWKNKVDRTKLDSYVISDIEQSIFVENVSKAKAECQQQKAALHQQHIMHITSVEELRKETVRSAIQEESESNFPKSYDGIGVRTTPATQNTSSGNIFTGMIPPWLQPADGIVDRKKIGPSLADYQKNLESIRRSKLPANRVGAQFDRDAARSADWLPSFGRVWNNGRRLASKQEFQKRKAKRPQLRANASRAVNSRVAASSSSSGHVPPNMNKYVL